MGKTGTSRLGLPYMGSKNKIANWVIDNLPSAEHFYDLFCGGGAITHAAMLRHKYKTFHMNDITDMAFVFQKVISGEYEIDYHWVSREEFEANKEKDHLMAMCWSFGNNGMDYLYSRELEPIKKACHYAVVFGDYTLADSLGIDLHGLEGVSGIDKRYIKYKAIYKEQLIGGENFRSLWRTSQGNKQSPGFTVYRNAQLNPCRLQHLERLEWNAKISGGGIGDKKRLSRSRDREQFSCVC